MYLCLLKEPGKGNIMDKALHFVRYVFHIRLCVFPVTAFKLINDVLNQNHIDK